VAAAPAARTPIAMSMSISQALTTVTRGRENGSPLRPLVVAATEHRRARGPRHVSLMPA
jgi:hypothetical protein